jgi:putative FmdB family regulatory protein
MPLYEYLCESCGRRSEALQRLDEAPLTTCSECGGPLRKLLSAPAFQFKGSGWYLTDYARKSGSDAGASKSAGGETSAPAAGDGGEKAKAAEPAAKAPAKPAAD